jgi:PPOX class probable F420-dependent enzyme
VARLTDEQAALFLADNYAVVATLRADGSPHQTATWVDWDGERVLFNITVTRKKYEELQRDARASVFVFDGDNWYRWVSVSGPTDMTFEGAAEHIHKLSRKYRGGRDYPLQPGEQRVIVRVTPERVTAHGFDS